MPDHDWDDSALEPSSLRLARVGAPGSEAPFLLDAAGDWYDIAGLTSDIDAQFLCSWGIQELRQAITDGRAAPVTTPMGRVAPPIAGPQAIVCVGENFRRRGQSDDSSPDLIVFLKAPSSVAAAQDQIVLPAPESRVDAEVEIGIVIGRRARYLSSPNDATDHVAGLVMANDLSERTLQLENSGGQWSKGKCCESFFPLGPWMLLTDSSWDKPRRLRSWVNGQPRQDEISDRMWRDLKDIVWSMSQLMVLEPGYLISTGTPIEGMALTDDFDYLAEGEVVEVAIEGLGSMRQRVVNRSV